ncbi:MAG: hypothetical protein RIK87_25475 [Fuerstiella sp.]
MIALFIIKLAAGITLMWWLMPRKDVTDGFFRIQMRVLLGLNVLAALSLAASGTWSVDSADVAPAAAAQAVRTASLIRSLCITAAVVSYAGTVFWALGRRLPGNLCVHVLNGLCLSALALHSWNVPNQSNIGQQLLSDFSSAALLGSVLTGMLLGHWYLTTPTMSIKPIWWFNKAIFVAVALRFLASAWVVADFGPGLGDSTQQVWLGIRWVGGILAPALMAAMVWKILKHRNTQSATGVLFAGLVLVFMGEMTASLLEQDVLIPY